MPKEDKSVKIIIVGAGLSGSLMAIYLAKKGFEVEVYEARPDIRKANVDAGRSINLALSIRGIHALEEVGIAEDILKDAIPMKGRMIHDVNGQVNFIPYGKNDTEYINSISRTGLNIKLIDKAEAFDNVQIFFNHKCTGMNIDSGKVSFNNASARTDITIKGQTVIGADGAASAIRESMAKLDDFTEQVDFLEYGYKELEIPAGADGNFQIAKNALHIWPRGNYMMIALPNLHGDFTCTLFLPKNEGKYNFANLSTEHSIEAFFAEQFADAMAMMPNLVNDFLNNPTGKLGTVKCFPWHMDDKALLLGDAAHAIVPFYGQGMNCAFEDCIYLNQCIDKYGKDWPKVYQEYENMRKENTDAIADLAIENFTEMRDHVANPVFQRKRQLEHILENKFDYISKYSMVTFHREIPYAEAMKKGNAQNEILMKICEDIDDVSELDPEEVYKLIQTKIN